MMASRLLFFDIESLLHIYERDERASFLAGRKLYERMVISLKEDEEPFVIPLFIYGFGQEKEVVSKSVAIQLYDISQTTGNISEEKIDIEDALKKREKALIIGDGIGKGNCEKTDIGLIFHVPKDAQSEQQKLWDSLLMLYIENCFIEKGCPSDTLVPFVKCILRMHFFKTEGRELGILNVKLANTDINGAYAILTDAFKVSRVLAERITYKRLSFNQTLMINGILQPEKENTLIYLEGLKESIQDSFLKWEVDDLRTKLINKSDDFIKNLYRQKITGNGIYTYPYINLED